MRWFVSSIVLSAIICGLSQAQENKETLSVLYSWHPNEDVCNSSIAKRVSLDDLLSSPDDYQGKCIRTEGYYITPALFMRKSDLHRRLPIQNEKSAERRLGIYATPSQFDELIPLEDSEVEVVGLMSNCEELYQDNAIMVLGYCHYSLGPIIGLAIK
jgi:hypothetical protein